MKPILFNTEMVQAIMDGRKTVTRRVVKPQPDKFHKHFNGFVTDSTEKSNIGCAMFSVFEDGGASCNFRKPPYQSGDILYVRETWAQYDRYYYRATEPDAAEPIESGDVKWFKWHPSIHMPKEAARIFLRVTNVRMERLQDITTNDIDREGTPFGLTLAPYDGFSRLWDSTIKPADLATCGWDPNPWVWVIEFERIARPSEAK